MKNPEEEQKKNNLNNSMQLSQKLFNPNLLLTDYNKYNVNDNNNFSRTIKIKKQGKVINKSSKMYDKKKIKILPNSNFSKNKRNQLSKHIFPNYITKIHEIYKNNKSIDKNASKINNKRSKKFFSNERSLDNSISMKIGSYSSNNKEVNNTKIKIKKNKQSVSKGKNYDKNPKGKANRNLNLTLNNFSSMGAGGTELKDNYNKSPNKHNLSISKKFNKIKINDEIVINRKNMNTTKNKLNRRIFGKMTLSEINSACNNSNINYHNNFNITLSNKNSNKNSIIFNKMKRNKKLASSSSSSSKFYELSLKHINKYSTNKKLEILKNNMNDQINELNSNYNKINNLSYSDNIKKLELIFDIILNSFLKFINLFENPKEKEVAFQIIQNLNKFFTEYNIIINNIIKNLEELNENMKKYKEANKTIEKENFLLINKIDNLQKKYEDLENDIKNNENIENTQDFHQTINKNGIEEEEIEENDSSVNTEELESIRFFDKIIMKKHSFSKSKIPELEIKRIKLKDDELEKKQNNKQNLFKYKNKNFKNVDIDNKNKNIPIGLRKKGNKSSKAFGYTKIAEEKKKKIYKRFQGIK